MTEPNISSGQLTHPPLPNAVTGNIDAVNDSKFHKIIESKERVYIFLHDFPDPDAIGAAVGIQRLIKDKHNKLCTIFGIGLSHPQNRTMVNALNLDLKNPFEFFKEMDGNASEAAIIWVDMNPSSTNFRFGTGKNNEFYPDWVIDHHIDKETTGSADNLDMHLVGSTCTIVAEYMMNSGLGWGEEDEPSKVASAMMLGIMTDTGNLKTANSRDIVAFEYLKQHYDQDIYSSIENYELNGYFFDVLQTAYNNREKVGSLLVLNLGFLTESRRDAIPFVADLWKKNKDVGVVIAFGLINNSIAASVRVKGLSSITATELARGVFVTDDSGGHTHMSGATVYLNDFFDLSLLSEQKKEEFLHTIMATIVERAKRLTDLDE